MKVTVDKRLYNYMTKVSFGYNGLCYLIFNSPVEVDTIKAKFKPLQRYAKRHKESQFVYQYYEISCMGLLIGWCSAVSFTSQ